MTATKADPAFLNRLAWNVRWSDRARSVRSAREALSVIGARRDLRCDRGQAERTLSWQAKWRGDFDAALAHALACEAVVSEAEAPDLRGDCYSILGVLHYSRHRMDLAQSATERGLGLPDLPTATRIDLLTTKSTIERYQGHVGKSGITLMRARDLASGVELARVEHNMARWMAQQDDFETALEYADRSIALAQEHENRVILPYALEVAGSATAALDQPERASDYFRKGIEIAVEDDDMRVLCQILYCSASFEKQRGNHREAHDQLSYGAGIADDMQYALWQKKFALALAEVLEVLGDLPGALAAHKSAWHLQDLMKLGSVGATPRSN